MKQGSTLFLRGVLLCIGIGVLASMLWLPQTEGRAANVDFIDIYTDPFILYVYIASIPFFVGVYQAWKLLGLIDTNNAFSEDAVQTLKVMKYTSLCLIGCIVLAGLYLRFFSHGDDVAGPTMLGLCLIVGFGVVATATSMFQKLLQNAIDIQSENEFTV